MREEQDVIEAQRDKGRSSWVTTAAGLAAIGVIVGAVLIDRGLDEAAEQARQEIIDRALEDELVLVDNSNGDVLIKNDGADRIHVALDEGWTCSAWVTVIEVPDNPDDPQRYAIRLDERDYYFTDQDSMFAKLGEDVCQPSTID